LAAGLRPEPLGELKCSPRPLAAIWGPTSKGRGREGREGEGRGGGRGGGTCSKVLGRIDAPEFIQFYAGYSSSKRLNNYNKSSTMFAFIL